MELNDYLPVLVMFVLAIGFVSVSVTLARFVARRGPASAEKLAPYECGIVPEVEPAQRFPVKFYLVAILFVVFDVEAVFFYPWGAVFTDLRWFGFGAMFVFAVPLVVGLAYEWMKGGLEW
jgi:NADH-quinone oxidoreductase subunit A